MSVHDQEALRKALRHALTFIENRFSDLSPEKRSTVEHIRTALASHPAEPACTCERYPTHCANDCPRHGLSQPTYTAGERDDLPPQDLARDRRIADLERQLEIEGERRNELCRIGVQLHLALVGAAKAMLGTAETFSDELYRQLGISNSDLAATGGEAADGFSGLGPSAVDLTHSNLAASGGEGAADSPWGESLSAADPTAGDAHGATEAKR